MNKKVSLGVCISLVVIAVTATFAITMVYSKQIYNRIISNISQRAESYEAADEIYRIISENYYGDLDNYNSNLDAYVAEGYVEGLGDSGCYYMTSAEYADYIDRLENGVTGIGIETCFNNNENKLIISYVYPDSPASGQGLQAGDVITAVNDETVTRKNYSKLTQCLTGSKLSMATIEYERDEVTATVDVMLGFSIPSIISRDAGGVGYIRISTFNKNTADELNSAVAAFKESGIDSIVFDVRNTSGGTVAYAAKAIDILVPNVNNIAVAKTKNGDSKSFTSSGTEYGNMNFAVLINSTTSGPAELFACDLRDISYALLVGQTTAGNGTMQEIFTLDDGSAISLTTALIIPYGGETTVYNSVGVSPAEGGNVTLINDTDDILLLTDETDNQLSTAISLLQENS